MLILHSDVIAIIPFGHDRWFTSNSARLLQMKKISGRTGGGKKKGKKVAPYCNRAMTFTE
jgi:hypothetical protein